MGCIWATYGLHMGNIWGSGLQHNGAFSTYGEENIRSSTFLFRHILYPLLNNGSHHTRMDNEQSSVTSLVSVDDAPKLVTGNVHPSMLPFQNGTNWHSIWNVLCPYHCLESPWLLQLIEKTSTEFCVIRTFFLPCTSPQSPTFSMFHSLHFHSSSFLDPPLPPPPPRPLPSSPFVLAIWLLGWVEHNNNKIIQKAQHMDNIWASFSNIWGSFETYRFFLKHMGPFVNDLCFLVRLATLHSSGIIIFFSLKSSANHKSGLFSIFCKGKTSIGSFRESLKPAFYHRSWKVTR